MAKQHLLIVDSDPKSLRVLEVSLKKAGFSVTRASNGLDAIEKIQISAPDMIITETAMPEMNGFELIQQLRSSAEWKDIPVMFLTAQKSIEDKIRGLEQGVEDYLTKPIFIREILARVSLVMQRRQRERLETRGSKTEFSGNLSDMGIIDLIQTIDISQKSGVIHVEREGDAGDIFFRNGKVIDASTSSRSGEEAVYRMLVWSEGHFRIEFKHVKNDDVISLSTQGLLMEGMRRLDEWGRLQEQLPSLNSIFDIDDQLLAERLGEIPDEINTLLKHFDGQRSLMEVVNLCPLGDLEALTVITKLFFEGLIYDMGTMPSEDLETAPPTHPAAFDATGALVSVPSPDAVVGDVDGAAMSESVGTHANSMETYQPTVAPAESMDASDSSGGEGGVGGDAGADARAVESAERPITGKYRLSNMSESETAADDAGADDQASKLSLPAEQKTMVMHVSRTPTDPPPGVSAVQDDEAADSLAGPPDAESLTGRQASMGPGKESPVPDGGNTMAGMVGPADFEELVHSSADIETTAPHTVVDDADEVVPDGDSDSTASAAEPKDEDGRDTSPVIDAGEDEKSLSTVRAHTNSDDAVPESEDNGEEDGPRDEDGADVAAESAGPSAASDDSKEAVTDGDTAPVGAEENEETADEEGDEEEDEEDDWAELDSATSRSYVKKVVFAVAAVVLLGGAAAIIFGTDLIGKPTTLADDTPKVAGGEPSKEKTGRDGEKVASLSGKKTPDGTANDSEKGTGQEAVADSATTEEPESGSPVDSEALKDSGSGASSVDSAEVSLVSTPLAPPPDAEKMAEYKKLVKKASKQSRTKQLTTLESAIAIHPNGVDALTAYTLAAMEKRKFHDKALAYARRVVQIEPGNAKAWLAIGYIYQLQNKTDESKEAYKKCSECEGPAEFVRNCKLLAR